MLAACAAQQPTEQNNDQVPAMDDQAMPAMDDQAQPEMEVMPSGEPDKTFVLTGENFKFLMDSEEAPTLVVNQGDLVRIELTSTDGFHDWVVDEFAAATKRVQTGETTSVEFIADTPGEFEYYCSVGQHRQNGMRGKLIVE